MRIQTSSARREDPNCKCCEERMLYHTGGSNPTKDPNGKAISSILPHMIEKEGLHLSILDGAGNTWKIVRWKDVISVEFDTKGGENA